MDAKKGRRKNFAGTFLQKYFSVLVAALIVCVLFTQQNLIRVNETLNRNQVYAEEEDFAFVANYIKAHCKNAKMRG